MGRRGYAPDFRRRGLNPVEVGRKIADVARGVTTQDRVLVEVTTITHAIRNSSSRTRRPRRRRTHDTGDQLRLGSVTTRTASHLVPSHRRLTQTPDSAAAEPSKRLIEY